MRRRECLARIGPLIDDQLIPSRVGPGGLQWGPKALHEGILYGTGLGLTTALGLGLAMSLPHRKVLVLDSDGGILMGVGVFATIGNINPPNLTVVIFDNGAYGSTGGQPTATAAGANLAAMGRGAGIRNVREATTVDGFEAAFHSAEGAGGSTLIVARVDVETKETESSGKILGDGRENMYRFVRYLERTEGKRFLRMAKPGRFDAPLQELSFGEKS
ncbi:MAG: thiamine pyrophosphate-dependent enzyme [Chloroflexota bacterium]